MSGGAAIAATDADQPATASRTDAVPPELSVRVSSPPPSVTHANGSAPSTKASATAAATAAAPSHGGSYDLYGGSRSRWRTCNRLRWACLASLLLQYFAAAYNYDLPAIMSTPLKGHLQFDNGYLGTLFAVYSVPNLAMPVLGGLFAARFGTAAGVLLFGAIALLGTLLSAVGLGLGHHSLHVLLAGRVVLGVGAEALYICMETAMTERFRNNELSFAYAALFSAANAGSVVVYYAGPWLAAYFEDYRVTFWIGAGLSAAALGCNALFIVVDRYCYSELTACEKAGSEQQPLISAAHRSGSSDRAGAGFGSMTNMAGRGGAGGGSTGSRGVTPTASAVNLAGSHSSSTVNVAGAATARRGSDAGLPGSSSRRHGTGGAGGGAGASGHSNFALHDTVEYLRHSTSSFWLVVVMIAAFCVVVFPFQEFGPDYFQSATGESLVRSGLLTGLLNLVSIGLGPLVGHYIDRTGQRPLLACVAYTGAFLALFALAAKADLFPRVSPFAIVSLLAVSVSILQPLLWPMLALLVPTPRVFGNVYGAVFALLNAGQVLVYWQIGSLSQSDPTYRGVFLLLLSVWCLGWIASVLLVNADPASSHGILTKPAPTCGVARDDLGSGQYLRRGTTRTDHPAAAAATAGSGAGAGGAAGSADVSFTDDGGDDDDGFEAVTYDSVQIAHMQCSGGRASALAYHYSDAGSLGLQLYGEAPTEDHGS